MKKALLSLSMLGLLGLGTAASAADLPGPGPAPAPPIPVVEGGLFPAVLVQLGPTTPYSTINCAEFIKTDAGPWKAVAFDTFGLGFVQRIVPPKSPIKSGAFIYNNIDLYSQLEEQCAGAVVKARY
jgi:hypothetical protein